MPSFPARHEWQQRLVQRQLCTGVAGYDGPTGFGTPNGTTAF
jgi:hypothetical protein